MEENNKPKNLGSIWKRWDLHVHSPASHGFSGTWKEFEQQIANANCDVIGINDYFSVGGYRYLEEKINNGELNIGNRILLPVVEFRMTESVQNKNTSTNGVTHFNFHIVFDPQINSIDIETQIKALNCNGSIIGTDYDDPEKLKDKKISFWKLLEILENDEKFRDKYLVWIPYDEYGGIDPIDPQSDGWIKEKFIRETDILGSSRKKQIDFFLWRSDKKENGDDKNTQEQFKEWFLKKKACIKGSDSHSVEYEVGKLRDSNSNPTEKYCWIKAEPSFEGLRQITYEPETRILIGTESPKLPINTISSFSFDIPSEATVGDDTFCFAGNNNEYSLSPYFNCFIGGRGSGKSTILNFFGLHSDNPASPRKFWESLQPSFDPEDREIFNFEGTEIFEYLAQSEIETFARDKTKFTQAIYNRANSHAGEILDSFENTTDSLKDKLDIIINTINELSELTQLKQLKEKEKRTLEASIRVLSSQEYKTAIDSITTKSKDLRSIKQWANKVLELKSILEQLIPEDYDLENSEDEREIGEYEKAYNLALSKIYNIAETLGEEHFGKEESRKKTLVSEIENLEATAKELIEKAGYTPESVEQIKSAPQKITALEGEIDILIKEIATKEKVVEELGSITTSLEENKRKYEEKITEILTPLQELLFNQYEINKGKDIKRISLDYVFDEDGAWYALATEFYDLFKEVYSEGEKGKDVCDFISENRQEFLKSQEEILNFLHSKRTSQQYLKFLLDVFTNENNGSLFYTIRAKNLYDVKSNKIIQVSYDNKDVQQASFGQRCTSVIVILLLFGNYPLIVDEPEAHLDSSLIANYLVPLLKKKKVDRQIIFATHNANFVINGDAEKIFILKNTTGVTEIVETTIEDIEQREELLKLEGGKEAFESRGDKLGIKNENN